MQAVLKRIDNLPDLVLRVGSFFLTFVFTHKKTQRVIGGLEIENLPFCGFWSEHFSLYRILLSALLENCKKFWAALFIFDEPGIQSPISISRGKRRANLRELCLCADEACSSASDFRLFSRITISLTLSFHQSSNPSASHPKASTRFSLGSPILSQ